MQEEDYTFVTIDSDDAVFSDAVIIDVEGDSEFYSAVTIDEGMNNADFITLADDTVMLSDADMDLYSTDINDTDFTIEL